MKMTTMCGLPAMRMAVLALGFAAVSTMPMPAQDTSAPPPPPPSEGGMPPRGGQMQEHQLERMTKQLNLTPDQVTQIKAIQDDGRQKMMALHNDSSVAGQDRRSKMMAIRDDEQTKIKAVLTDDQKTKYSAMQEHMRERQQERRDSGSTPPPPPPSN